MKRKTLLSTLLGLAAVIAAVACIGGMTVLADDNDNNDSSDSEDVVINTIDSVSADNESVDNKAGDNIVWSIEGNTLTLTGYGPMYDYDWSSNKYPWISYLSDIRNIILDDQITHIGDYAFFSIDVISIDLPQQLESIGKSAFSYSDLYCVTVPSWVTSINESAFSYCDGLIAISLPRSLTYLGPNVFMGDTALTDIYLDADPSYLEWVRYQDNLVVDNLKIHVQNDFYTRYLSKFRNLRDCFEKDLCGEMVLWNTTYDIEHAEETLIISGTGKMFDYQEDKAPWGSSGWIYYAAVQDGVTSIGNNAFNNCDDLRTVEIPDSVTGIGFQAFKNCSSLADIDIPDSVTYIGGNAFYQSGLASLSISGNCQTIGDYAFCFCNNLETVTIDSSLIEIGEKAFYECKCLKTVSLPDTVTSIGESAFAECSLLETINLPASLTEIINGTFSYCYKLTDINIPDSVTSIGYNAFNSSGLTSVSFPDSVLYIEMGAFRSCKLTSVIIPGTVSEIGSYAFADNNLTSVEICDGVRTIGESAFSDNENLTTITFPGSVKYIENNIVSGCNISSVTFTDGVERIEDYAFYGITTLTSIDIPGSVTSIGYYSFAECNNLNTVNLNYGLTHIESKAFINCANLKSIRVPDSVIYIGSSAFSGCSALKSAKLSNNLDTISSELFYNCSQLETVIIPNSVTRIGQYAFSDCSKLQSISIPNGVTYIDSFAFYCCDELATVTIPESVVEIGENAFAGCISVTDVYCFAIPGRLSWVEDELDFMIDYDNYDELKLTVCHVNSNYVNAFNTYFSEVNVRFVGGVENISMGENNTHLYGYSLSLDGNIGVNFYMTLDAALTGTDSTAYMLFMVNGRTFKVMVRDITPDSNGYYIFRCDVAAKEMSDEITAQLYSAKGIAAGSPYSYCVRDYAAYILSHADNYDSKTIDLVKAMLNYGAYSQKYFKHNTRNLANSILSTYEGYVGLLDSSDISNYVFSGIKQISAANRYITFVSANIELESEIVMNFYIKGMPDGVVFTCNGETLSSKLTSDGSYTVVSVKGIAAKDIDSDFTISFTIEGNEYSFTYSPMNYCYNVLSRPETETRTRELKEVISALYWYNQTANEYIGQ